MWTLTLRRPLFLRVVSKEQPSTTAIPSTGEHDTTTLHVEAMNMGASDSVPLRRLFYDLGG